MAIPVASVTQTTFAVDATDHAVSLPAIVAAGDLLLALLTTDGSATVTTPDGWERLYSQANGTAVRGGAYVRTARGDEDGSTVNFVTSAAETGAAQVFRILAADWNGTLSGVQAGTTEEGSTGTTVDPVAIVPLWGSAANLWIAVIHFSTTQTISNYPDGYTDGTTTSSGSGTTHAQVATARKDATAASEDPGTWTFSGTGASKVFNTIAICPAGAGPSAVYGASRSLLGAG